MNDDLHQKFRRIMQLIRMRLLDLSVILTIVTAGAIDTRTSAQSTTSPTEPSSGAGVSSADEPSTQADSTSATVDDPGWPRTYARAAAGQTDLERVWPRVVVYQPQVDSWKNYRDMLFRCALAVHAAEGREPVYGVMECTARTVVDDVKRTVSMTEMKTEARFPHVEEATGSECQTLFNELVPALQQMQCSLDRVLAYIDAPEARQREVEVSLEPPPIFYSNREAILVNFRGTSRWQAIEGTALQYAINCNWDLIVDPSTATSYLLYGDSWIKTRDVGSGAWEPARKLPDAFNSLPDDDQWSDVRSKVPGVPLDVMPKVFVSDTPGEIIITDGDPVYVSIPGVLLKAVSNTESPLFRHVGDLNFYYLVAGRWFRAPALDGPWSSATRDLPADFKQIPRDSEWAYVLASVPGTDEAADAVMLASIPRRATVRTDEVSLNVSYLGAKPDFAPIEGTSIEGATNTMSSVFRCNGKYYCCENAVWFVADQAQGPWQVAKSVPDAIYDIPPTHPSYNVTYASLVAATEGMVETQYTSGYDNALVTAGVLVLGAGVVAAVAAADDVRWNVHINLGGNTISSYGSGAFYDSGTGFFCRSGGSYGPYAGRGGSARYNPSTGGWNRRPPAGGSDGGWSGFVSVHGSSFGAPLGGGNRFQTWSRGVQPAAGDRRAAIAARPTPAGTGDGWRTAGQRGRAADGDLYAGRDGQVFKRDAAGNWQQRESNGWRKADAGISAMEREAMARGRGIAASTRSTSGRSSFGVGRSGGVGRRGGGRR